MFKLWCFVLIAAFSWQLSSCRYIGQQNYHSLQPYPALPYPDYGYTYSGPSLYQPTPYQLSPYQSPSYSPPGTYYDHRRGILRPFPGGGVPVLVDYHKRCSNQYVGLKPHPDDRQYYYVCKPDSVVFGKCQNLQVFNSTCGQCVQYPRPEYMPNCESVGRFPIYSDCRIYFKCEEDLMPQIYSCPQNMIFSPANQKCIAGNHCATTQISNSGSNLPEYCEGKFPPCYENGVFRSPADCSLYYTCELQTTGVFLQTRLRCTEGNFYDKQKNQCLPKQHVPCDCIQVAELVYPKPNPLPFHSSVYPAQFDIDSLEENYYPIEKSEEDIDSTSDSAGDEDTVVTPETMARMAAIQSTTVGPVSSTAADVAPTETTDEINVLNDSIDMNKPTIGDAMARTEKTTTATENTESSTNAEDDKETTVSNVTAETTTENSTTTTPATPANVTMTLPVNSTTVTSMTEATTEPDVFTTKAVEETTISQDLEGSGSDPKDDNEDNKTTETDDTKTTTVAEDSSSSVSPSTTEQTTTPAAPANSTIASARPQSASRSQAKEDDLPVTDTQTLNKTLSPPTPTPEVPETSLGTEITQTAEATTQTPTTHITETPTVPTTESFTDVTLEDDDVGLLDSEISIDDFKQTSQKEDTTLDNTVMLTEELLPITTKRSLTTTVQDVLGTEITEIAQAITTSTQEPPTTIRKTPLTTINPTDATATTITEDTTAATTDSTTDVTLEDDEMGLLDSEISMDDSKKPFDNNLLVAEELLPVTAKPTVSTTVREQQTEKTTLSPDEATTQTPTITIEASTIVSTEISTEDPLAATTENFTDVALEDDVLGLLDSEISMDDSKTSSRKDEENSVNNLLAAEEMLPVKSTKSTKPNEAQHSSLFKDEGTTLLPENNIEDDDINAVLGSEITETDQTIATDSPTTPIPINSTLNVTEMPTTATTESFTDVTLEDDEMGLLDSEIFIDDSKPDANKDQTTFDDNLLLAENFLHVATKPTIGDEDKKTSQFKFDDITSMPEDEETTITTALETSTTTEQPSVTTIKHIEDNDELGVLDSELILSNKTEVSHKTDATMATTEALNIATDPVTTTELPVTQAALTTFVNEVNDLITDEDELGLLDSEVTLPDVRTNQASSDIPSTPDTTEKTTQTSSTTVTLVESSTETPTPTHSTTISTTQTPTVTPKYNASTSTIPTPHSLVIKVREDNKQSPNNSPNKSLYFTLHTKPVINNNNTNSCNQTVTEPPCDKPNTGEIPRLEIIAERPIDVHFSICPPKCDKDHKHNYSSSSNRAVHIKWFPNKSNQTMSFETSSNIKTEGD